MLGLTLVQGLVVFVGSAILWKLTRQFVVKSSLDSVAGPPGASLLTGSWNWFALSAFELTSTTFRPYDGFIRC
jgi:uncharacterized membrane protein YgdD (TMEM256/DUF423 family)